MQYSAKNVLLTMSIMAVIMTLIVGQMAPASAQSVPTSSNLVKRDYSYTDDQHLTASFGNTRVCGDHLCASGEWTKLHASLNQAQISHPPVNSTKSVPVSSSNATNVTTNSTVPVPPTMPITPAHEPVPTPPSVPSSVCVAVKAALGNSTVSTDTVAKIMSDLGCSN